LNNVQYEELCRHFIARNFGLSVKDVKSITIPNPRRPGLPKYKHQIDLYWETGNEISLYLNIANAKWRSSDKVDQGEVLLLYQVRQEVDAHKAFMISSVGFTAGAIAVAKHHGIALHAVTPAFNVSTIPDRNRTAIRARLGSMANSSEQPIFAHRIENRGLDITGTSAVASPRSPVAPHVLPHTTTVRQAETRVAVPRIENAGIPASRFKQGGPERRG